MAFCSNCGNALGEGQQFCSNCGRPVSQAPPSAAPAQPPAVEPVPPQPPLTAQPAAYTPPAAYAAPPGPGAPPPPPPAGYPAPPGYAPMPPQAPGQYGQPMYATPPKQSRKGLWIGLASGLLVVVIACVLVFVVFRGDIFGGGGGASNASVAKVDLSAKDTPSAIMAASMKTVGTSDSVAGTFDLKLTMQADSSSLPPEQAQMFADPWTLSGDMAFSSVDQAGDFTVKLGMMGETMNIDLRMLGGKIWLGLSDQWYEMPADTEAQLAEAGTGDTLDQVQQLLSGLSIDPTGWLKNQAPVQEEKIDGVKVLHISGSDPNWPAMVGDLAQIMLSPEFQSLMASSGAGSSLESQLPSPDELLQLGTQLDQIFQNVQVDIWVEKDTARLRKVAVLCDVVAPADTSALEGSDVGSMVSGSGITGMSLDLTLTLDPDAEVSVEAPDNPKSSDQLQSDLESNPALLGPLGELLMGLGSGMTDSTSQ